MAVNEQDIELLDGYLDDALSDADVEAVRGRLAGDAAFRAALEAARAERGARAAFFAAIEPGDGDVSRLVGRVRAAVRERAPVGRGGRFARIGGSWRYAAAAAACVVVGFMGRGLIDRDRPSDVADGGRPGVNVQQVSSYQVTLRDDAGRVVAVQRFDSLERAQEFANDLSRWQSGGERLASGQFVVKADRF